jgi:Protein of unknown function (DUF3152)
VTYPATGGAADHLTTVEGEVPSRREAVRAARRLRRRVLIAVLSVATAAALVATDLPYRPLSTSDPVVAAGRAVAAAVGPSGPVAVTTVPGAARPAATHTRPAATGDPDVATDEPVRAVTSDAIPPAGTGSFRYAPGPGPVAGRSGPLLRFRVAVEVGTGQDQVAFADAVDAILADPRGWKGEGLRFQRVPELAPAEFTIFLASPVTSELMCAGGGLRTERYSSCRLPGQVIINWARWMAAVPNYGASIAVYRAYAINHEVGHELGYGHEACPAPGQPAPVMQQQTYGLRGCTAYAWPYLNGMRYTGPPVA